MKVKHRAKWVGFNCYFAKQQQQPFCNKLWWVAKQDIWIKSFKTSSSPFECERLSMKLRELKKMCVRQLAGNINSKQINKKHWKKKLAVEIISEEDVNWPRAEILHHTMTRLEFETCWYTRNKQAEDGDESLSLARCLENSLSSSSSTL